MTKYEYKTVELPTLSRHDNDDLQPLLNEHAIDGWRFKDTVTIQGETAALIFEREVN